MSCIIPMAGDGIRIPIHVIRSLEFYFMEYPSGTQL